jgi:hypothetical protein
MSQDTFPFAEGEDATPFAEEGEGNRKAVLVAGGVAAALVVAVGGWFFLGGSGDSTASSAFVPNRTVRPAVVAPKHAVAKAAKKLPTAYKAPLGRDPFKALYVVPVAAPATTTTTTTPTATGTTPTASGTTPTSTGTGTTGTTTTTPTATRYTLKLVSISKPSPDVRFTTWSVGGTKKVVIPAQRFGKYGELVVLAFSKNAAGVVDKAIIQVGDDSPMDVAVGESVSVL